MMSAKFLKSFFLIALISQCGSSTGNKFSENNPDSYEGIVTLSARLVDANANLSQKDSILYNTSRSMYLYKNTLIDIKLNSIFEEESFVRNDTTSYVFYNFSRQNFIEFKRLSKNVEVLRKGKIDEVGQFSQLKNFDPFYDMPDSLFQIKDTIVKGKEVQKMELKKDPTITDIEYLRYANLVKAWVDPQTKGFPLQMSYSLSKKRKNGFVYQRELPMPEGNAHSVLKLDYEPKKLSDSLIAIFKVLMEKSQF